MQITNEEVSPGVFPQWLYDHLISEISDPLTYSKGGPSKLLVVYPNDESRVEILSKLSNDGFVVDRNLHHTISSLMISIMNDFRMPKLLKTDTFFDLIIHEECVQESKNLGFPLINPLPTMYWGRGKTSALVQLHKFLSSECIDTSTWEGPGIQTINKILKSLEIKMNFTHPDFLANRLINNLKTSTKPFSLIDIDGIIMLNHSPITSKIHLNFLSTLSVFCPVHQLANKGNFRKGEHGVLLLDQYPIKKESEIPPWVPNHRLDDEGQGQSNKLRRVLIHDESESFNAALSFADEKLAENSSSSVIIVDPNYYNNISEWNIGVKNLGIPINPQSINIKNHPLGYWINLYLKLGHDSDSFSLSKLRSLSLQTSINLFPEVPIHPLYDDLLPIPDLEILNQVSMENHILGGPGALERWLDNLSKTSNNISEMNNKELDRIKKQEQTLWWLLCVSKWLNPILPTFDQELLNRKKYHLGLFSDQPLPLPESPKLGDQWLLETLKLSLENAGIEELDGLSGSSAGVIQSIFIELTKLRDTQRLLSQKNNSFEWVDEVSNLMNNIGTHVSSNKNRSRLRVLPIDKVLGCTADIIILANISSQSWSLKVPKMYFLDDEERNKHNLLRADSPVRNARHMRQHIFNCASEVIILDPSLDESTPAAGPISEWVLENDCEDISEIFELDNFSFLIPKIQRQKDGKRLENYESPVLSPINISAVTISHELNLQRDRERRQPKLADIDGYLSDDSKGHIFQFKPSLLWKNSPRNKPESISWPRKNERWPVYSAIKKIEGKEFTTPTIDPRPFSPEPTGVLVSDNRNGHLFNLDLEPIIWSPTTLQDWLTCPRKGWLTHGIKASIEDSSYDEGLDSRIHGTFFHQLHYNLLSEVLGFKQGSVREINNSETLLNLSNCEISDELLMQKALEHLHELAPWLTRTDSVSKNRLRMMSGLSTIEWIKWLDERPPAPLSGRLGEMINSEKYSLENSTPIAFEWKFNKVKLSLPKDLTAPYGNKLDSIKIKGSIDRVDIIPFMIDGRKTWINDKASKDEIAPLELYNSDWQPRRLIVIRDLKTFEKTKSSDLSNRHKKGILEELQLALYARAWEIENPGDLVVGVGISILGQKTTHFVEISKTDKIKNIESIGEKTEVTYDKYRFLNETSEPESDPFRAWLASRISTALNISNNAQNGYFHPIPQDNCKFCKVQNICDVKMEATF